MLHFTRSRSVGAVAVSALAAGMFLSVSGCQHTDSGPGGEAPKSLYDRLGGEPAIKAVVDDFVGKATADPDVNFTRTGHANHWDATTEHVAKFKKHLVQFIEVAAGGPQKYEGGDMTSVHTGMGITELEWAASVADLKAALADLKVPAKETSELLSAVAGTHDQIVGK